MTRFLESLPGLLSWTTLIAVVLLSWQKPVWIAFFIILFDTYWLLKTVYLSLHLRSSFKKMRANLKINWLEKLQASSYALRTTGYGLRDIYHLVILPMHDEPYEVVKESFASLTRINYPKEKLILALAIEERAGTAARQTAQKISEEFSGFFFKLITDRKSV